MSEKVKQKILIVEDDAAIRYSMLELFNKENFEVIIAENGKIGLELAVHEKPDMILLDLLMPEMGGQEFLNELRKDAWGKRAKVIVLTNFDKPRPIYETLVQNRAEDYLIKANTSLHQIVQHVRTAIAN